MAFTGKSARTDATPLAALARDHDLTLVATDSIPHPSGAVAFDDYVFEDEALVAGHTTLERGFSANRSVLAVASVPWLQMPMAWTSLQSRDGRDHLELADEMEPVGHDVFDRAFAVDADDPGAFRRRFRTSMREWIVEFDAEHGPLVVIFDGHPVVCDTPPEGSAVRNGDRPGSAIFVAREVLGDAAFIDTMEIATTFAAHCRDELRR